MDFRISGLPVEPFIPFFSMSDEELQTHGASRVIAKPEDSDVNPLLHYLLSWFPMLLLIGVWVFFMRQMQAGGGRAMGFGKSRARMLTEKQGRVTFDDVAGIDDR